LIIRPLTFEDLDDALRLSTVAGWNQRLDDWRMLLQMAPATAFAARLDARTIGTVIGIDYGGFAWIAMMLVDPEYRGRGVGRRLLEIAIDTLPSTLPIRLDATSLGRPLYRQYGFEDEAALTRYLIVDRPCTRTASSIARPLTRADLPAVLEQDRATFDGSRETVLGWMLDRSPQYARVARSDDGSIHYCLGREGRLFDQIGPVIAGDDDIARALVSGALEAAEDRHVIVDAFDSRKPFAAALRADGFAVQRPLVRMRRPAASGAGCHPSSDRNLVCEFAILGPEFA